MRGADRLEVFLASQRRVATGHPIALKLLARDVAEGQRRLAATACALTTQRGVPAAAIWLARWTDCSTGRPNRAG